MIHALGYQKAHIVGHDWGGAIAWNIAIDFPEFVDHLCVLNCPHPYIFAKALRTNFRQIMRSWYILLFQIPYLPEYLLESKNALKKILKGQTIRKDTFTDYDLDFYYENLQKPQALHSAMNYYRAAFRYDLKKGKKKMIEVPTLLIWAENDAALDKDLTEGMDPLFSGPFHRHFIPNCSHWVNEEQPEIVNNLILKFLSSSTDGSFYRENQ